MPTSTTPYTFHWICPRPACHTCYPHPKRTKCLKPSYFNDYEDVEQYKLELEAEDIGTSPPPIPLPPSLLMKKHRRSIIAQMHRSLRSATKARQSQGEDGERARVGVRRRRRVLAVRSFSREKRVSSEDRSHLSASCITAPPLRPRLPPCVLCVSVGASLHAHRGP
jgi:hypothetical protein